MEGLSQLHPSSRNQLPVFIAGAPIIAVFKSENLAVFHGILGFIIWNWWWLFCIAGTFKFVILFIFVIFKFVIFIFEVFIVLCSSLDSFFNCALQIFDYYTTIIMLLLSCTIKCYLSFYYRQQHLCKWHISHLLF